ncbi:hypothetical protein Ani05nite_67270 [Amorphoplanes nipponensis]|uniref:Phage integrase, N-terminal SAM-like domain n=2 Tax=Actinoplanes nipponensis TaxID=135950 RepID=A0A919MT30_9ACTN|nr:hypothetical protein [Actinoplanes nipponensis]GIE53193.1 hypothetical protein Ani05nite_67270 [Actinoplanes nipponensis]
MERLSQGTRLLFDAMAEDRRSIEVRTGRSLSPVTVHNRVKAFIEWVNQHARSRGREAEAIPADAHGAISLGRFRRTLAWHIARRPGGLVALAVQYGHLRTLISEGYANPREMHQAGEKTQATRSLDGQAGHLAALAMAS